MDTKWTHEDKKKSQNLVYQVFWDCRSDLDWIQTSNLLSRNQMRYSVAPRGLVAGANIAKIDRYPNRKLKNNCFFLTTTNFNIYLSKALQVT